LEQNIETGRIETSENRSSNGKGLTNSTRLLELGRPAGHLNNNFGSDANMGKGIPIQEVVDSFAGQVAHCMTGDEYWSVFGYEKRPKHGAAFRSKIPARQLAIEDFILTELMIMSFTDIVLAIRQADISEDDSLLVLTGLLDQLIFAVRGWRSYPQLIAYLHEGLADYHLSERDHYSDIFFRRGKKTLTQKEIAPLGTAVTVLWLMPHLPEEEGLILVRSMLSREISSKNLTGNLAVKSDDTILGILTKQADTFLSMMEHIDSTE